MKAVKKNQMETLEPQSRVSGMKNLRDRPYSRLETTGKRVGELKRISRHYPVRRTDRKIENRSRVSVTCGAAPSSAADV